MTATHVGNYRLLAQLGSGGMADVFLGVDNRLAVSKLVVVKRVRSHLADDAELCALLLEEARVSARLNHPNVVQVLDAGAPDGECFLAMEYLDGQSLSQLMKRAGAALPTDAILVVLIDVLRALHYAHELTDFDGTPLKIVHRDVSPQNVFVTYDGLVKLLDFGIAKAAGRATETREGFLRGKIRYMPPEQALGMPVDGRSDIFAAGILVWQAITGRRFWGDAIDPDVMSKLASRDYDPSPRRLCPDVPPALDAICRRALAAHVDERYPTASAMVADLEDYIGDRIVELRKTLTTVMRDVFREDRERRREIIEELGSASTIASSIGAIVLKNSATMSTTAKAVTLDADPSSKELPDETRSLANMLEPSMARRAQSRRRPRLAMVTVAAVAFIALVAVATARVRQAPARISNASTSTVGLQRLEIAYASDGLTLAAAEPIPESQPETAVEKPSERSRRPSKPARAGARGPTKPTAPEQTPQAARGVTTGGGGHTGATTTKPGPLGVDKTDPWR